jgi:imidazolonepropionase-like amidohydrolase
LLREKLQITFIHDKKIEEFVSENDFKTVRERFTIKKEIYGDNSYLIPGLSDIHAHLSLISEFDLGLKGLRYFDAQRQKNCEEALKNGCNCEEALKNGCTFVRDSAGASNVINYLKQEIEQNKLLGPRIIAATEAISPKGGMWDLGFANLFTPMIFGGKVMNFPANSEDLEKIMDRLYESGCDFFKTYFEDKPIYYMVVKTLLFTTCLLVSKQNL